MAVVAGAGVAVVEAVVVAGRGGPVGQSGNKLAGLGDASVEWDAVGASCAGEEAPGLDEAAAVHG